MGRGCSQDPRQLCAQAENGQAGRGSYLEAAVGETVSPVVEAECGDAGSAAVVTPPGQAGRDPNEGEEQLATPGDESGDAEEESAMDAPGDGAVPTVGDAGLGGEAAGRFVRVAQGVERPDRAIGSGGETGRRTTSPGPVVDDAAWSGTGDGPGFCADHRGCGTLAGSKQLTSYLGLVPSEHSSGNKRRLGAITKQGNCFLRKLLVEAAQTTVRK